MRPTRFSLPPPPDEIRAEHGEPPSGPEPVESEPEEEDQEQVDTRELKPVAQPKVAPKKSSASKPRPAKKAKVKGDAACDFRMPVYEHEVIEGEIVSSIAARYGVRVGAIKKLNPRLDLNKVRVGQKIKVCPDIAPRLREEFTYEVKDGDNLSKIGEKYGLLPKEIVRLQHGSLRRRLDGNINSLKVGDELTLVVDRGVLPEYAPKKNEDRGTLKVGVELTPGKGYFIKRPHLAYGTARTVKTIKAALSRYKQSKAGKGGPQVHVGDISARGGGPLKGHMSHQKGIDVDIGLVLKGEDANETRFRTGRADNLDIARTWALLKAFVDSEDVTRGVPRLRAAKAAVRAREEAKGQREHARRAVPVPARQGAATSASSATGRVTRTTSTSAFGSSGALALAGAPRGGPAARCVGHLQFGAAGTCTRSRSWRRSWRPRCCCSTAGHLADLLDAGVARGGQHCAGRAVAVRAGAGEVARVEAGRADRRVLGLADADARPSGVTAERVDRADLGGAVVVGAARSCSSPRRAWCRRGTASARRRGWSCRCWCRRRCRRVAVVALLDAGLDDAVAALRGLAGAVQLSVLTMLPSSHCSTPAWSWPSPHFAVLQVLRQASVLDHVAVVALLDGLLQEAVAAGRCLHVPTQLSVFERLPSSHCSHVARLREGVAAGRELARQGAGAGVAVVRAEVAALARAA